MKKVKNTDIFEKIYQEYFDRVFRFIRGLTADENLAEEITEETFFKTMKSFGSQRHECDIFIWLCQIAKNTYFSHIKKQKHLTSDEKLSLIPNEENLQNIIEDKDLALQLHKILHNLNEPYKEVFSLRVFGELSFREIVILFGKSDHWACVTFHRAKQNIQNKLRSENHGN